MTFSLIRLASLVGVALVLGGCSSLSGNSRDAFAPYIELSKPKTVDNVIVGGSNPYATAVPNSLSQSAAVGVTNAPVASPTITTNASSQAAAQKMIYEAVKAQCGDSGTMGPVENVNGQWVSRVQCGEVQGAIPNPYNAVQLWPQQR